MWLMVMYPSVEHLLKMMLMMLVELRSAHLLHDLPSASFLVLTGPIKGVSLTSYNSSNLPREYEVGLLKICRDVKHTPIK